ncbi:MAG: RNA polymerase sigma factor [bacterium]
MSNFLLSLSVKWSEQGNPNSIRHFMTPDEIELISRAREGNDDAFAALVEKHDARVMSLLCSILGPGFDAEEAYQEVFLKLYRNLGSFRFESEFSTWLHRLVVNTALSKKRSLTRRQQKEQIMDGESDFFANLPANPVDNPENVHLRSEIRGQIEKALTTLPDRQRTVFVLKHEHGLKLREIAKILGISEGSVKAYLFRAVEMLRKRLEPYYRLS